MKKAMQTVLKTGHDIIVGVTAIGVLAILVISAVTLLSGCQNSGSPKTGIPDNSPFNTSENGAWGKEDNFLRMTDLTDKTEELVVDDFAGGPFTLSDERLYTAVVYLHNTSDAPRQGIVITLSHPDVLEAEQGPQLEVLVGWNGADSGFISDQLEFRPVVDLSLYPVDNDDDASMAIVRHGDGSFTKTMILSTRLDGVTTHMVELDEVASDEVCVVFFTFEALATVL